MRPIRLAVTALAFWPSLFAQTALKQRVPEPKPEPKSETKPAASELPITRVALYKNGVGFFEHAGRVSGDQSVTIDFTSAQLNDVLQSLTAIDLNGGRISGAGYNSTTPLEEQLKTLPLALTTDPSDVDFYNAIRGARVQVSGAGASFSGRLLAIDLRNSAPASGNAAAPSSSTGQRRFVTVVSDAGQVHTFELTPAVSVTLLDPSLHTDVTRYLELLASTRNEGLRHLTLLDRGTGARDLRVSYISEVPVWKSTYRILFTDARQATDPTATLQGWSVVDNTTGSDWTNVHLDLIAGAPQSFIQPLSIPYYARRPEIGLPTEAQLAPQTHESGEMKKEDGPPQTANASAGFSSQRTLGTLGMAGGVAGGVLNGRASAAARPAAAPRSNIPLNGRNIDALSSDTEYQRLAGESFAPNTTTAAFDDFFEYTLSDPITIRKNESALVPILQTKLPVERVTLWSARQPVALRALWITNASNLTLDRGSFSIVENGSFGGEGLLDPIHPGEKRLLSYAADQAVHVDNAQGPSQRHLRSIVIAKGILTEHFRDVVERDYTIRNAAPDARTVIIEHNRLNDHQLNALTNVDGTAVKPDETLPNAYRFRVVVAPGKTVHLKVDESHAYPSTIQIGDINAQRIKLIVQEMGNAAGDDPALPHKLQPVIDSQAAVADIERKRLALNDQIVSLRSEEERQRANIVALKDTDKLAQKRFVDELGKIEDQILDLQKQQAALDAQLNTAKQDLADKVQAIQFDQTLEP